MRDDLSAARGIVRGLIYGSLIWAAFFTAKCSAIDLTVGANIASFHSKPGYETLTPGLYVRNSDPAFVQVGAYRNSQGFLSVHAGVGYSYVFAKGWDATIAVGAVSGYREWLLWENPDGSTFKTYEAPKVRWYAFPSVGYAINEIMTVRAVVLPPAEKLDSWVMSIAIEGRF